MKRLLFLRFLVFSVLVVGAACPVQTSYPRTWENGGWIASNENIMDLGYFEIWYTYLPAKEVDWAEARLFMLPFHESLEEAELEALNIECHGVCNSTWKLGTALRYKTYADDLLFLMESKEAKIIQPAYQFPYAWNLVNYVGNWKAAMDYSLISVEIEARRAQAEQMRVSRIKEEASLSGICDVDYSGPANWICTASVDDVACNSFGLWDSVPDMEWYPDCMRRHWAVQLALAEKYENMSHAWEGAKTDLDLLGRQVRGLGSESEDLMLELKFNELGRVNLGIETRDVGGVASVRDSYWELMRLEEEAEASMGAVDRIEGSRIEGWYKKQYGALKRAQAAYERIGSLGPQTLSSAGWLVEEAKDGAEASLSEARGSARLNEKGREYLETAEALCGLANAETRLGVRFEEYVECRKYARMAVDGIGIEESAGYSTSLSETEGLVRKAEWDGMDVDMEKALVAEIKEKKPTDSLALLRGIRESIMGRAVLAYAGLPEERARAAKLIEAGGAGTAFLKTWLPREDCYHGAELDYGCAIGELKDMRSAYAEIIEEIELNADTIVGNALLVDYAEGTSIASLEGESDYHLVVRARNDLDISAQNVVFTVPAGAEIRKIDLIGGSEHVRVVSHQNGEATIQLMQIGPKEDVVLDFRRAFRPCTVSGMREISVGDAFGRADVTRTMRLDCSMKIDALMVGDEARSAVIDGNRNIVSNGILAQNIQKGTHNLEVHYVVDDAYSIEKNIELATTAGSITTVSYMIDVKPRINLDKVPLWVDESAKAPSKIDVFGYTGERLANVRKDGVGVVYFEINGLRAGELAKVRVRYEFSNISGYLGKRIDELAGADLSPASREMLANASNLHLAGDYIGALSALEKVDSQVEKEMKEYAKLLEKHRKLEMEASAKASMLRAAIAAAGENGIESAYISEMRARLGVLEEALGKNISRTSAKSPLEGIDLGWEGKELTKIQKYVKDSEVKIKKEWMASKVEDAGVDAAISRLEEAGAVFSGTMDMVDGVFAMAAVRDAQAELDALKARQSALAGEKADELSRALASAGRVLARYEGEYGELPSGHRLVGIFEKKPNDVRTKLSALELSKDAGAAIIEAARLESGMEAVLDFLDGEGGRTISNANSLYKTTKASLGDAERREIETGLELAKNHMANKKYVKAILIGENVVNGISKASGENDGGGLLVLAATALMVIGAVVFLLLGKGAVGPGGNKGKTQKLRRLKRVEEEIE